MGCCASDKTDPNELEILPKGGAELVSKAQAQEDGFFDVTLESYSQEPLTYSDAQSPMGSFGFLAPGHTYFAEKVLQLASKNSSFQDRFALASTREESELSLPTGRLAIGHIRSVSADFACPQINFTAASVLSQTVHEDYPLKCYGSLADGSLISHEELDLPLEEVRKNLHACH